MTRARVLGFAALLVLVLAFPAAFGRYPVKLLQEILIWGVYAMSLDLLMGHAGMVSFGHSAFFGVGGYVAALALTNLGAAGNGPFGALLLPAAASAIAALVIGFFSIRVGGVYFIMLTLAFSQMFHAYAFQTGWLGAAAFILLQSIVSTYTERWMLILGVTFVLFVLFAPGGIMGALRGRIGLRA